MNPERPVSLAVSLLGTTRGFNSMNPGVIIALMAATTQLSEPAPTRQIRPPRRWKLWMLLSCGIYPIITIVETVGDPVLRHLTRYEQFALVVPVMVAVMVWVVIPAIHRYFGAWMAR